MFFFFSSRRRHTRLQGDWSSDVCSSDLLHLPVVIVVVILVAAGAVVLVLGLEARRSQRRMLDRARLQAAAVDRKVFDLVDHEQVVAVPSGFILIAFNKGPNCPGSSQRADASP